MSAQTLYDKLWNSHLVRSEADGTALIYIDRHLVHEVTSPQAFAGLDQRGISVFRPEKTVATPDHNVPTTDRHLPIADPISKQQVDTLRENCQQFGVQLYGLNDEQQGIVPVMPRDGAEALRLFAREPVQLVLLDHRMPGISGLKTIKALRTTGGLDANRRVPVIFMTDASDRRLGKETKNLKLLSHLSKPFRASQILHLLKIHLG